MIKPGTTHPQTTAGKLKYLNQIASYGCCAFVCLWMLGIESDDDTQAIMYLVNGIDQGVLGGDCTVLWGPFTAWLTGKKYNVEFKEIHSLNDVKMYGRVAVRYDFNGKSHWVGVENGKLAYNPLEVSECVKHGHPATARILTLA